jgi:peptide/nickel transport system substrate-binding protein
MKRPWLALLAGAAGLLSTGCVATTIGTGSAAAATTSVLTVNVGNSGLFPDVFNPFAPPGTEDPTFGMVYEPLMFFDTAKQGIVEPWLSTGYKWGTGGKSITFSLRHGVTWQDGTPFTSADVAFTFDLIKANKALNQNGLPLAGVTTSGPYSVTVNFTRPAYSDLIYVAGKTYIVPAHIWKHVKDPATWPDPKPVGTGAYELQSISGSVMTMVANPHYYMPGMPKTHEWRYLSFTSNTSNDLALEQGQLDWGAGFIPNINKNYLARNPKFTLVDIPLADTVLLPNMVKGPQTSLDVRKAISDALNRPFISNVVYNGYAPPTNPTGLLTPNFSEFLNPALDTRFTYNVAEAKKLLESAGYKMGSDGYFQKGGKDLSITVKIVAGYTDYVSILGIAEQELKAAGIKLVPDGESYSAWASDQDTGNFQFLLTNYGYTPSAYFYYNQILNGSAIPPVGSTDTAGDYGRYNNPKVDALLAGISATADVATQRADFYKIESIFAQQLPVIPLFEAQDEIEFNGNAVAGFPTVKNPYAAAAPWLSPDLGWVAMRLAPVG